MPSTFDPTLLSRYGNLALHARGVVDGLLAGMHKSPFKGFSVEFAEHRQYYPGDEIRHVDWRVFGKTDRYFIKEYEEETTMQAWLVVDASGSMGYAGQGPTKYRHASEAAIVLAYLLLQQRDSVGLFVHDEELRETLPASNQTAHWLRLAQTLEARSPGGETRLGPLWNDLAPRLKRRGLVILLSDGFGPLPDLLLGLRRLRHARHEVVLLQVLAPEEIDFPFKKAAQFRGLEDGRRLLVDPARLRTTYREAFDRHCRKLRDQATLMGVDYQLLRTDEPLERSLGEFLTRRQKT